jgi:tRNA(Ile)-lysidine synthase TilS/MesJ
MKMKINCYSQKTATKQYGIRPLTKNKKLIVHLLVFLEISIFPYKGKGIGKRRHQLVRPLLSLNRHDALKLCKNMYLPIYPDVTNEKLQFLRNRLRKQLLPLLRYLFNPQFDKNLFYSSELFLQEQLRTETILSKLARPKNDNKFNLSTNNPLICDLLQKQREVGFAKSDRFQEISVRRNLLQNHKALEVKNYFNNLNTKEFQKVKQYIYFFLPQIGTYFISK